MKLEIVDERTVKVDGVKYRRMGRQPNELRKLKRRAYMKIYRIAHKTEVEKMRDEILELKKKGSVLTVPVDPLECDVVY